MEAITIEEARGWMDDLDPVHDFGHILRVYRMAERIGTAEGADVEILRAAALLHDSRGSAPDFDGNVRAEHHEVSASFASEVLTAKGWPKEKIQAVQHCIRAHRFRNKGETPETIEAKVLYDADKLDVLGAIGAARTIAYAALNAEPIYAEPSKQFIETGQKEAGEPHSSYHEFLFKLVQVKDRLLTDTGKRLAEGRHRYLRDFYAQLQAEVRGER